MSDRRSRAGLGQSRAGLRPGSSFRSFPAPGGRKGCVLWGCWLWPGALTHTYRCSLVLPGTPSFRHMDTQPCDTHTALHVDRSMPVHARA